MEKERRLAGARCHLVYGLLFSIALVVGCLAIPIEAGASCNQIPGVSNSFRSSRGTVNRPFAGPGDVVEVRLGPTCEGDSTFETPSGIAVSVHFTPPAGPRQIVVLGSDCAERAAEIAACGARNVQVTCRSEAQVDLVDLRRLRFAFPDTDDLVDAASDDRTLAGPAAIMVAHASAPLHCAASADVCAEAIDPLACIDRFYRIDGTCGVTADPVFPHFTALPPANDYQAVCSDPSPPCTGLASELRFTIDSAGNLLMPMDWSGILAGQSIPVARLLRASSAFPAFPDRAEPIRIPGPESLRSFSPEGGLLPPIFQPQRDPGAQHELTLFGTADAPRTVLQFARYPAESPQPLFDFASRFHGGVGPVLVPRFGARGVCQNDASACLADTDCASSHCVGYRVAARHPAPLDSLIEADDVFVSVVPEAIDGIDLNGDGDARDHVVLLADPVSGIGRPIGSAHTPGRAAAQVHDAPFAYAAVAAEDDIVAFLEAEPLEGDVDVNQDGDRFDTILRIFRMTDGAAEEITAGPALAADAAPLIDGRSLTISAGLVFARLSEPANARQSIERASHPAHGGHADGASGRPVLSHDGRHLAFESDAGNLAPGPAAGDGPTTYVVDLEQRRPQRVVIDSPIVPQHAAAVHPWLSGDGRYVAVAARDRGGVSQLFVYDRDSDADGVFDEPGATGSRLLTQSTQPPGLLGDGDSLFPFLSTSGRFLVFQSRAVNLTPIHSRPEVRTWYVDRDRDRNGIFDEYGYDADGDGLEDRVFSFLASVNNFEGYPDAPSTLQPPSMSRNGRFAFASFDRNLGLRDDNDFCLNLGTTSSSCADVLVRGAGPGTALVSVSSNGEQGNNQSLSPMLSDDGDTVAFVSAANNLVPGDTNGAFDVFVHDLRTSVTSRISVASDGTQADGSSFDRILGVSADGRYVAFSSAAGNLVAGDDNRFCDNDFDGRALENCSDLFLHDRVTGFTRRLSVAAGGGEADGASRHATLSGDGLRLAFESLASNLVPGDRRALCDNDLDGQPGESCADVFVAGPATNDASADLNGDGDARDTLLLVTDTRTGAQELLGAATQVAVDNGRAVFLSPETQEDADLNDDGDRADSVVQYYPGHGAAVVNLQRAASAVALSAEWIGALVSEREQGGVSLNGDDDLDDNVLHLMPVDGQRSWVNAGISSDVLALSGSVAVVLSDESADERDLNGDGDRADKVVQIFEAEHRRVQSLGLAAADLVAGPTLLAFRVLESAQGGEDLNGDGDSEDAVLHVYDVERGEILNSGQAATPCRLAPCHPRFPYRVLNDTVKFLTLEAEQGEDLNGDGDRDDLVLQVFNTRARAGSLSAQQPRARRARAAVGVVTSIAAISSGVCSDSGQACLGAADCGAGASCFQPPGHCIANLGSRCDTTVAGAPCGAGAYCVPGGTPGRGTCHRVTGACQSDVECAPGTRCQDAGVEHLRLFDPLASGRAALVLPAADEQRQLTVATAADADGDELADSFDNCPGVSNVDQQDGDRNGIGDACEAVAASPTPTVPVVPTPTTPAAAGSNSGCRLIPGSAPGHGAMWVLLGGLLLGAVRRRGRFAAVLSLLCVVAVPARSAVLCAGDCDGSGEVSIDEIVGLTHTALSERPADCAGSDLDGDGKISVDEIVTAVQRALGGCPVDVVSLASSVHGAVRALANLPSVELLVASAFAFASGPSACELGGEYGSDCTDGASGAMRIRIQPRDCGIRISEGGNRLNGTIGLNAIGLCQSVIVPSNLRFDFDLHSQLAGLQGQPLLETDLGARVTVESFDFGAPPCRTRGAVAELDGPAHFRLPSGEAMEVELSGVRAAVRLADFQADPTCDPATITVVLDGTARIGKAPQALQLTRLTLLWRRLQNRLEIDGTVHSAAFRGPAGIHTVMPLGFALSEPCFSTGSLQVTEPERRTWLLYEAGRLSIDEGIGRAPLDSNICP